MRLLFIHGWGSNGRIWQRQLELSRDFKLEILDLPGHGSPERWDRPDLTPGLQKIESILRDGEPTLAIGWSLGGQLLLDLGGRIPFALKGIVTVGSTPSFVRKPGFSGGITPARARNMRAEVVRDFQGAMKKFGPVNFSEPEEKDPSFPDWLELLDKACIGLVAEDVLRCLDGIIEADSRASVSEIRTPVLVVHGTSDAVVPFDVARYLAKHLSNVRLHEFPRAGHAPFMTRAEEFNRLLQAFAKEITGR